MTRLLTACVALAALLGRGADGFAESPDEVAKTIAAANRNLDSSNDATRRAGVEDNRRAKGTRIGEQQ